MFSTKVIFFNQWFSSITSVIEDLKFKYEQKLYIIASSKNENHAYKNVVDKFIVESWKSYKQDDFEKAYIEWLLKTLKDNDVDIFFCKKYMEIVSKYKSEIEGLGVTLVTEDYSTLMQISKKSKVYDRLKSELPYNYIPWYTVCDSVDKRMDLCREITERCLEVNFEKDRYSNKEIGMCLKLDSDEGGASFKKIVTNLDRLNQLKGFRVNTVTVNEINHIVRVESLDELSKFIFMDMLDSPEISVDCYNSKNGFIAVCREKVPNTRLQRIYTSDEITSVCSKIQQVYEFKYPFNVQFRCSNNNRNSLKLLEINPRMSGGIYYMTLLGLNICEVCMLDILGMNNLYNISNYTDIKEKTVTHIEQAILLE